MPPVRRPLLPLVGLLLLLAGPAAADPGELTGPLPAAARYRVGDFLVAWTPAAGGALRVGHADEPGRVLWASRPGRAFCGAALGAARVRGQRGSVDVRDRILARTDAQTVTAVGPDAGALVVSGALRGRRRGLAGRLRGAPAAPAWTAYALTIREVAPDHLELALDLEPGSPWNRTVLHHATDRDERILGFGRQFTHLDLKGRRVPVVVGEQGIGRGVQPLTTLLNWFGGGAGGSATSTYSPAPYYLTSRSRGLYLTASEYSEFDLRDREAVTITLAAPRLRARVLHGARPLDVIAAYTRYAGRMAPLPDWAHRGAVIGTRGGEARVRDVLDRLERAGVPVAALFVQDWVGERATPFGTRLWWSWQADPVAYPDWPGFVRAMRARDVRVMGYVNPFLVERPGAARDLWAEAVRGGFLVDAADGRPYAIDQGGFEAGLVDLTDPAARDWLKGVITERLLDAGVSGWMGDFGEALPFDGRIAGGSPASFHNRYPEAWARLQREAVREAGLEDEVVYFSRSGYTRSPGHARLFWLGDQLPSWDRHDGLASAVTGLLSGGISGYALDHGDVGGYTTIRLGPLTFFRRGRELLLRWAEAMAFTAMLRTHEGLVPGSGVEVFDDEATARAFGRSVRIFRALFAYRRYLMRQAARTGAPLVRHPWLHYPDHPELLDVHHELMLGSELLVPLVLRPGRDAVEAVLPPGRWVHAWTGRVYGAPGRVTRATVPAPLGEPAMLVRAGSPLGPYLARALAREGLR